MHVKDAVVVVGCWTFGGYLYSNALLQQHMQPRVPRRYFQKFKNKLHKQTNTHPLYIFNTEKKEFLNPKTETRVVTTNKCNRPIYYSFQQQPQHLISARTPYKTSSQAITLTGANEIPTNAPHPGPLFLISFRRAFHCFWHVTDDLMKVGHSLIDNKQQSPVLIWRSLTV